MASPTFHAIGAVTASANNVANGTLTPALPTRSTNDVLLCFAWSSANGMAVATPAGWTLLTGFPKASATAVGGKLYVFADIVDGSETAPGCTFTSLTTGTTGTPASAVVASFSGVNISGGASGVLDGTVTLSDQTGSTTTVTIPSITTALNNSLVLGFALKMGEFSATFTPPSGWTEILDTSTTSGTGYQTEISDKAFVAPGATGSVTCAPSVTTSSRALGVTLALKALPPQVTGASINATSAITATVTDLAAPTAGPLGYAHYAVPVVDAPQLSLDSRLVGPLVTVSGTTQSIVPSAISSTSGVTASIARLRSLVVAAVNATSSVTAAVVRTRPLSGAINATSSLTAAVGRARPISGASINATSSLSAAVVRAHPLSGTINATSTVTGTVVRLRPISASISSSSTVSGSVVRLRPIGSASLSDTSTVTASLARLRQIAPGVISSTSAVAATVSRAASGAIVPSTINSTSTVSGALVVLRSIKGASINDTSNVTGSLVRLRSLTLSAIQASSTVTATIHLPNTLPQFLTFDHAGTDRLWAIESWLLANEPGFTLYNVHGLGRIGNIESWLTDNPINGPFVPSEHAGTDRLWAIEEYLLAATAP